MHDVQKTERNRGRERKKSVSFFSHRRQMEMLSSGCRTFSLFLLFFTIMCSLFLSFTRSLARFLRARQLSKMETFIPFYLLFSYIHAYIHKHTYT
jgi:hypothetical protein